MSKTKDRPVNMPCSDPEGCKHFKAEMKLEEENKRLRVVLRSSIEVADTLEGIIERMNSVGLRFGMKPYKIVPQPDFIKQALK